MKPGIGRRRRRSRWLIAAGVTGIAAAVAVASRPALSGWATGARLQRMKKSPEWQGSHFENPQPIVNDNWAALVTLFRTDPNVKPKAQPTTAPVEPERFAAARDAGAVVISPRPGQSVEPTAERPQEHWWPALPWRSGAQNPIVAHHGD